MKYFIYSLLTLTTVQPVFAVDEAVKEELGIEETAVPVVSDDTLEDSAKPTLASDAEEFADISPELLEALNTDRQPSVRDNLSVYFFLIMGIVLSVLTVASLIPPKTLREITGP